MNGAVWSCCPPKSDLIINFLQIIIAKQPVSQFNNLIIQLIIITMIILIVIHLLLLPTIDAACFSICQDRNCSSYAIEDCTGCNMGLYMDSITGLCMVDPSGKNYIVDLVTQTWSYTSTEIVSVQYASNIYTEVSAFWNSTGLFLYDKPADVVPVQSTTFKINLFNLPPHHELYVAMSAALGKMNDPSINCLASFVDTNLTSGQNYTHVLNSDEMVLTKLFSNHTLANQQIIIGSGGPAMNPGLFDCQYVIIKDISIVLNLCPTGCGYCQEPDLCTTCAFNYTLGKQLYFDQILKTCVPTCANYYYQAGPPQKFICNKCDKACLTCTVMFSPANCITCNETGGYYLQLNSDTYCAFACPSGQYPVLPSPIRCALCNSNCLKCLYTATNCSLCGVDSFGRQMYLSPLVCNPVCGQQKCILTCPPKYYANILQSSNVCTACDSTCWTCLDSSNTSCLSCGYVTNKLYYLNLNNKTCTATCTINYYTGPSSTYQCNQCDIACRNCSAANSSTSCYTCNEAGGYVLALGYTNKCILGCPSSQYITGTVKKCQSCNTNCLTCINSATNCLSCGLSGSSQMYLTPTATCSVNCPSKMYPSTTTNTCIACHSTCLTCSGPLATNCLTCDVSGSQQLFLDLTANTCNLTCSQNYFSGSGPIYQCNQCDISCLRCTTANTNADCQICNEAGGYNLALGFTNKCISGCPQGQYVTGSPKICSICNVNCLTCQTAPTTCLSCGLSGSSQMYLTPTATCSLMCPTKYFPDPITKTCLSCHSTCLSCSGSLSTNCLTCDVSGTQQLFLDIVSSTCNLTCSQNYYSGSGPVYQCNQCDTSCLKCSIANSNNGCSVCNEAGGYNLALGSITKCTLGCPQGQYVTGSPKICSSCNTNCLTCQTAPTTCLSCGLSGSSQMYLTPSATCSLTCPLKYFPDSVTKTCLACHSTCLTCSGPLATNCLSCDVSGSQQLFLDLAANTCNLTCSQNYYSGPGAVYQCNKCDISCLRCTTANTNADCQICNEVGGYNLALGFTNKCILGCPQGQYVTSSPKICSSCNTNCLTCQTTPTNCLSCGLSGSSQMFLTPSANCSLTCPTKYYPNSATKTCLSCHSSCLTCSGGLSSNCLTCDVSGTQQLFLDLTANTCNLTCSQNYFSGSGPIYQCNQCDVSCLRCTIANSNNGCSLCNEAAGYSLALGSTTKCILGCPLGQYMTGSPKVCSNCDSNCLTCITTPTNCLSCGLSGSSQMYLTPTATCNLTCPTKYYPSSTTKTCISCHSTCLTCSGGLASNCLTCDLSGSQQLFLDLAAYTCNLTCSQNYFSGSGSVNQCNQCDISCLKCSIANSNNGCTACNEAGGYNLALGSTTKCILGCPQGQYVAGNPKICTSCNTNCLTCLTISTNCLSCGLSTNSSQMYLTSAATCSVTCPIKYFPDSVTKTCLPCQSTCLTCSGPLSTNCLSCDVSGSQQLFLDLAANTCNLTCSQNYYSGPGSVYQCNKCDISCLKCTTANTNADCQSCNEAGGYNLALGFTNKCILGCPQGQYVTGSPKICSSCNSNCLSCLSTSTNCLSCGLSSNSSQMYLTPSATCSLTCPTKYYPNSATKTCLPCHSTCLTCSGDLFSNCLTCDVSGTQQLFLDLITNTCNLTCSQNYFSGSGPIYQCNQCDVSCLTCSIANSNTGCTACNEAGGYNLALGSTTKCILGCPQGQYVTGSPKICSSCNANCLTCQTAPTTCLSCGLSGSSQMYLTSAATCSVTCPIKYFPDSVTKTCLPCQSTCLTCSGPLSTNCLSCDVSGSQQLFLDLAANTCNLTCSQSYYSGPGAVYQCNKCDVSCLKCTTANTNADCQSCNEAGGYNLALGFTNKCILGCPQGQYVTGSPKICSSCNVNCLTCQTSPTNCLSCGLSGSSQMFLTPSATCSLTCPTKYYPNSATKTCLSCHSTCLTCSGGLASNCLSCDVSGTQQLFLDLITYTCNLTCSQNYYSGPGSVYQCNQCDISCLKCSIANTNTGCTACNEAAGYNLALGSTNTCIYGCPSNQFLGGNPKICQNCNSNCNTCSINSTNCLSCGLSGTSQMFLTPTATCAVSCPSKYYPNSISKTCLPCDPTCLTCYGPLATNCITCDKVGSQQMFLNVSTGNCSITCSQNFYSGTGGIYQCDQCDISCLTCSIANSNNGCTVCNEAGGYNFALGSTTKCILGCPQGQYVAGSPKICYSCNANCLTCQTTSMTCLSCGLSGSSQMYLTPAATCSVTCPTKYYSSSTTKTCLTCHSTCLTCSGPLATNCLSCDVSGTQQLFLDLATNTCNLTCSQNYYSGSGSVYQCNQCDASCSKCSIANSNNGCTACNEAAGYNFALGSTTKCISGCPQGTYVTGNPKICSSCNSNCLTCQTRPSNCLSCGLNGSSQMFLTPSAICSLTCPTKYYPNSATKTCLSCHSSCLTCSGPLSTNCLSCDVSGSQQLFLDLTANTCNPTCSLNYYNGSGSIYQCNQCHVSCLTCTSPNSATACTGCNELTGYNLVLGSTTLCSFGCPVGQFVSSSSPKICQSCSSNCLTCAYLSTNCTSCGFSAIGGQMYLVKNGTCVYLCPSSTYIDSTVNKCLDCHSWCQTCWGPLNTQCNRCNNVTNTSTAQTTIYYLVSGTGTCSLSCPDLQYIDARVPNYCQLCSSSCLTCAGNSTTCLTCQTGNFFINSTCIPSCPTGTYQNQITSTCTACDAACSACTAGNSTSCQACKTPYLLSHGTTSCITTCLNGQYANTTSNLCLLCNSICLTCINSSTTCVTCSLANSITPVYLFNNTCMEVCPTQYFGNDTNNTNRICSLCAPQCLSCSTSAINCFTCRNVNSTVAGVTTTMIYYKDAILNVCQTSCGSKQFMSQTIPNTCGNCSEACTQCSLNSTNCQKCATGYFLHIPTSQCLAICPQSFYNNPTMNTILDTFVCSACASECKICTGPTSSSCSACTNVTSTLGVISYYFKQPSTTICSSTCPTGYLANKLTNNCELCQNGCISCSGTSTNCSACTTYLGVVYYLDKTTNTCATICPNGGTGNQTDYICYSCQYYTYNDKCIQSCPSGYIGVIGNISTCVECSSTDTTCSRVLGFTVNTKVVNQGKSFEHRVNLAQGLSSTCTPASLAPGLAVSLVSPSKGRLLVQIIPLSVQSLSIGSDGSYIMIYTNSVQGDLSTSNISVSFRAGALISYTGVPYNQLAADMVLNNPTFMYSYIQIYSSSKSMQAQGIFFVVLSFILLLTSLIATVDENLINDCMSFIQLIQIYGLSRIRPYPFEMDFYNFMQGFSHYELGFIPNAFSSAFPDQYSQTAINSLAFSIGSQNLILNYGSLLLVFMCLQVLLLIIYYIIRNKQLRNKQHYLLKFKLFQQNLIVLWSVILLFGSIICLLSTQLNKVSSSNLQYSFSVLGALTIFVCYSMYFAFWVFRNLKADLFKVNSLFRLLGILFLVYGQKFSLMYMNLQEIFFFVVDFTLYRETKASKVFIVVEKLLSLFILNLTFLSVSYSPLMIASAVCFSLLALINLILLIRSMFSSLNLNQDDEEGIPRQSITEGKIKLQKKDESFNSEVSSNSQLIALQGQYSSHGYRSEKDLPAIELIRDRSQLSMLPAIELTRDRSQQSMLPTIELIRNQSQLSMLPAIELTRDRSQLSMLPSVELVRNQSQQSVIFQFPRQKGREEQGEIEERVYKEYIQDVEDIDEEDNEDIEEIVQKQEIVQQEEILQQQQIVQQQEIVHKEEIVYKEEIKEAIKTHHIEDIQHHDYMQDIIRPFRRRRLIEQKVETQPVKVEGKLQVQIIELQNYEQLQESMQEKKGGFQLSISDEISESFQN